LERLYAPHRAVAFELFAPCERALVVPCGTGQDLPYAHASLTSDGRLVGVDLSPGMVARAEERVAEAGWDNIEILEGDATQLGDVVRGRGPFDLVVCSLGLTVVPDYEAVFESAWQLLRPGGQMVIFDVWAEKRTLQTWQVEKIARADLDRKVWEPLERVATDFDLRFLEDAKPSKFGGRLFVAAGRKGGVTPNG
jgi:demethylmenaquinone methyltransferase/2-methoxy-6-polyprenyl-1,4-benzoquinol methylase